MLNRHLARSTAKQPQRKVTPSFLSHKIERNLLPFSVVKNLGVFEMRVNIKRCVVGLLQGAVREPYTQTSKT